MSVKSCTEETGDIISQKYSIGVNKTNIGDHSFIKPVAALDQCVLHNTSGN